MKAQTLSICMPGTACDKKCPYCVSKMTWAPAADEMVWRLNIEKVRRFAEMSQVTDVVITGKGEPCLQIDLIKEVVLPAFGKWPLVLQTNGRCLAKTPEHILPSLRNAYIYVDRTSWLSVPTQVHLGGIDIIAVSIDDPQTVEDYVGLWMDMNKLGIIPRITVMLTKEACKLPFMDWIDLCKKHSIRQLSFREITEPSLIVDDPEAKIVAQWIQRNKAESGAGEWLMDFPKFSNGVHQLIRRLPYGACIYDVRGVAVSYFEYCVQDSNGEDDIRSLIYNQDGHLYTTWSSPASLIF